MAVKNHNQQMLCRLANLPNDVIIKDIVQHPNCDEIFVEIPPAQFRVCPYCGSIDCVIKDSGRTQTVRHITSSPRGAIVTFHKRRMFCKDCKTAYYENPDWLHESLHMTKNLYRTIFLELTKIQAISSIAKSTHTSDEIVNSVLSTISCKPPERLPVTLCIDEFKGDTSVSSKANSRWNTTKFHCNITDGDAGAIIEILPYIDNEHVSEFFRQYSPEQRARVKYFCCDMHQGFTKLAKDLFPQAHICLDKFHVIRLIEDKVSIIRRRLQSTVKDHDDVDGYKDLKGSAYSLLKNELKCNPDDALTERRLAHLNELFEAFPELHEAYNALHEYYVIDAEVSLLKQKAMLMDWTQKYHESNVPELIDAANTIKYWRSYIYNSWEYHRSNGVCEGLNNKIKVLKRVSFGLHSFDTFRKRVLLTCGYVHPADESYTILGEKSSGGVNPDARSR